MSDTSDKGLKIQEMESAIESIYLLAGDERPCATECEDFFLRFDMSDFIDELKRWRKTHASEGFSPDWCAARSALKNKLTAVSELRKEVQALKDVLEETAGHIEYDPGNALIRLRTY